MTKEYGGFVDKKFFNAVTKEDLLPMGCLFKEFHLSVNLFDGHFNDGLCAPLEDLPLMLDHPETEVKAIVNWRLKIGK